MLTDEQLASAGINPKAYQSLRPEEKAVVDEVLKEFAEQGKSDILDSLYDTDYDERPVDFIQFITDDAYLGKTTRNGDFLYPFWRKEIQKIYSLPDVSEVAFSGSIGIGKTTAAVLAMVYHLYKIMCMKDPQAFFNLSPGSEITYAFLNNTLSSSYGVAYKTFQAFVQESPWFLKHGKIAGRTTPEYYPEKGFGFIVGSRPQHTLGKHVIAAIMDEVSFAPGQNVSYEKSKIMDVYTNIRRRMESRFMVEGRNYGMMFLVSSKATESSFLEAYIADQVKKGYPIYVVDQPLWKVKPAAYSGKMFKVAVGNKYVPSRVIADGTPEEIKARCDAAIQMGLRIIDVPVEHRQAFDQNLDKALQDVAGISTSVVTKTFSIEKILKCKHPTYTNPFRSEVVTLGVDDTLKLQDFFDVSLIPDEIFGAPIFIHLDASVSGDRTGLSGVGIVGTKEVTQYSTDFEAEPVVSEELVYQQVFTVGIQAPSDSEISFEKTRQFIYYLRDEVGLNIKFVSTDGFQSVDTRQILKVKGFEVGYTSLDRSPDGYDGLKSAINDQRIILLQGCQELDDELSDLERDNMTRKYDHPVGGKKDEADSLGGALLDASKYKDEFLFFKPSEYDYSGLNENIDPESRMKQDLITSVLGKRLSTETMEDLFSEFSSDSNILLL